MKCTILITALILLAAALAAGAGTATAAEDVPKLADAKSQYGAAALLEKQVKGTKGLERRAAQEKAATAFEAVGRYFPEEAPLAARALYRAASLYERFKDRENAVRCLKQALGMQAENAVKARSHLLLGHIYRRARSLKEAIDEYQIVINDHPRAEAQGAEAMGWLGKCKARLGDQQGAREVWETRITRFPTRFRLVVDSSDWIACSYHREGRMKEARETLETCRKRMADLAADSGPLGHRVRKALAGMRIVRLLEAEEQAPDETR